MVDRNWLERTAMRTLQRIMGIKRIDKIRNEEIRARPGVANISGNIREDRGKAKEEECVTL